MDIKITNAKKVRLEKGDTLFFEVSGVYNPVIVNRVSEQLQEIFPDQKVIVLTEKLKLKKIAHTKE